MSDSRSYYNPSYTRNSYDHHSRDRASTHRFPPKKRSHSILPPPAILQAYEDMVEGAAERLIEMAEKEQVHRHEWEDTCLRYYNKSHRIGQIVGFFIALSLLAVTVLLALKGEKTVAVIVAGAGFLSLTINTLVTAKTRRFERKPRREFIKPYTNTKQDDEGDEA